METTREIKKGFIAGAFDLGINRHHGFSSSGVRDRIRGLVPPKPSSIFEKAAHV